jgi:uncharacterized protein (DUF362 family)
MRNHTRREWLARAASAVSGSIILGGSALDGSARGAAGTRRASVAIAKCRTYGPELLPALEMLFDQIGGLKRIVNGKTVAIKINLTGSPSYRVGYLPLGDTHYTNPHVIGATVYLMGRAGAKRIRLLESPWATADPIEEYLYRANWEPRDILGAAPNVAFENTNYLGASKQYTRFRVPDGGRLFPGFDLNHSYLDCDVFVSLAKMKEHATTGITLSMKNCFGITPATIYGEGAGVDEPSIIPAGGRGLIHDGSRQPSKSAPGELDPRSPRDAGYRVPRTVVDLVAARPIDLAIVEGVKTIAGGEGPWLPGVNPVAPGVIVAGTNPVATDAVCMAVMGFDPMSDRGTPPFETSDNMLRLAADAGLGPRELGQIELAGAPIAEARFDFAVIREERKKLLKQPA